MATVLQYICPCLFVQKNTDISIEMPLIRNTQKMVFPVREPSTANLSQQPGEYPTITITAQQKGSTLIRKRSTSLCWKQSQQNNQKPNPEILENEVNPQTSKSQTDEFKSFRSFPKSSSVKRSVKVLRFPQLNNSLKFQSARGGLVVSPCYDLSYQHIMEHVQDWTNGIEYAPRMLPQRESINIQRIRRIALLQVQTKAQEFQYFMEDVNTIYKNPQLSMQVDLKTFQMFESNVYATLCRFRIPCSVLTFFSLFNLPQCQARLRNLTPYKIISKQPNLILYTQQISNMLVSKRQLHLLKFYQLIVEEINGNEKKLVVEIDRDISEVGESSFRRIVCVHHQDHMPLEVDIYTQTTMNFKPAIDHVGYFKYCHQRFAEFMIKKVNNIKAN